jgi:Lrp/AsnC family transcriptional regulator for asnA, asnC and gidA
MALAYVLVNSESGAEGKAREALSNINEVKEAHVIYGVYDIILKVESENMETLKDTIRNKIRKTPHVRSTLTLIVV